MTRDEKGKFVKGHPPMGGRPKKEKEEKYYKLMTTTCTKNDWVEIIKRAISDAKRGDSSARTWLSNYIIGPANQSLDITSGGDKIIITVKDVQD